MTYDHDHLPDDPSELKRIIAALLEANAAQQKTLDEMVAEIAKLNTTIQKLTEMLFGKKNKKLVNIAVEETTTTSEEKTTSPSVEEEKSSDTSGTSDTSETSENPAPKPPRQKKPVNGGGGRMKLPDNLPVTIVEKYPPEHERTCTECETPFKVIGFETSRQVVYIPPRFEIIETHNMKCIADCPCSACRSVTAEPDIAPIDKGIASVSLLAIMIVMKYADHLPLARQATRIFLRSGIQFSQSSMCRWARKVADLLEPLYDMICELVLMAHCLQLDASFVKCRDENLKGKCRQCQHRCCTATATWL